MQSLKMRIALVLSVLTLIVFTAMIATVNYMTEKAVYQIEIDSMYSLSKKIAYEVDSFFDTQQANLKAFSKDKTIINGLSENTTPDTKDRLQSIISNYDHILTLYIFDTQGKIRSSATKSGNDISGMDISNQKIATELLNNNKKKHISEVGKSESANTYTVSISTPIYNEKGKIIGGIVAEIDWQTFSDRVVNSVKIGKDGYPFIINAKGDMISHPSPKLLLQNFSSMAHIKQMIAEHSGVSEYIWQNRKKIQAFHSIKNTGWIVSASAFKDDLLSVLTQTNRIMIGIGIGAAMFLAAALLLIMNKSIFTPLVSIMKYTESVTNEEYNAQLSGTFTCEMQHLSENVQSMVMAIKKRLGFAQSILNGITSPFVVVDTEERILHCNNDFIRFVGKYRSEEEISSKKLAEVFYGDPSRKTITSDAIGNKQPVRNKEVEYRNNSGKLQHVVFNASPMFDLDGKLIGAFSMCHDVTELREQQRIISEKNTTISEAVANATAVAERVANEADVLNAKLSEVAQGTDEQSKRVTETATAIEEMNATVLEVAKNAASAAQNVDSVRDKAVQSEMIVREVVSITSKLDSFANHLQGSMTDLGKQAESIGHIMSVITDIADQTNLLALNAAIEAARAGDAGRGFAVVADEVRKLAEKTMTATNEVGQAIKAIQGAAQNNISNVDDAVDYISQCADKASSSGEALAEIVELVSRSASQVAEIAAAAEQQSATSEQISRSVEVVNEIVNHTAQGTAQSASSVHELANMSGELNRLMVELEAS